MNAPFWPFLILIMFFLFRQKKINEKSAHKMYVNLTNVRKKFILIQ
jgi:hypothetical protein